MALGHSGTEHQMPQSEHKSKYHCSVLFPVMQSIRRGWPQFHISQSKTSQADVMFDQDTYSNTYGDYFSSTCVFALLVQGNKPNSQQISKSKSSRFVQ